MRVIVFSDSHQHFSPLQQIVEKHPEADFFIHLGDGYQEFCDLQEQFPQKSFFFVHGNCDFGCYEPALRILSANQAKILCVHGHTQGIKYSSEPLLALARQEGCQIALHGHTHAARIEYHDGIYLVCPGSVSQPRDSRASYAILDITGQGIVPVLVPLGASL